VFPGTVKDGTLRGEGDGQFVWQFRYFAGVFGALSNVFSEVFDAVEPAPGLVGVGIDQVEWDVAGLGEGADRR